MYAQSSRDDACGPHFGTLESLRSRHKSLEIIFEEESSHPQGKRGAAVAWTPCLRSQRHYPAQWGCPLGTASAPSPLLLPFHPYWKLQQLFSCHCFHLQVCLFRGEKSWRQTDRLTLCCIWLCLWPVRREKLSSSWLLGQSHQSCQLTQCSSLSHMLAILFSCALVYSQPHHLKGWSNMNDLYFCFFWFSKTFLSYLSGFPLKSEQKLTKLTLAAGMQKCYKLQTIPANSRLNPLYLGWKHLFIPKIPVASEGKETGACPSGQAFSSEQLPFSQAIPWHKTVVENGMLTA